MIVYPAIDIRQGRCVRLVEGDFTREVPFDADPVDAARRWVAAGAAWLHVVDLDGAVVGEPVNGEAITRIRHAVDIPIQLGGGLRLEEHLAAAIDRGIDRVILGTAAIHDQELIVCAVDRWNDRVAVALDVREGRLAARGWLEQTEAPVIEVAQTLHVAGVEHFVFTDIHRDGTLSGPNLPALRRLVDGVPADIIASGGIGSLDDVTRVAEAGAAGVVIGRALYDGRIELGAALAVAAVGVER